MYPMIDKMKLAVLEGRVLIMGREVSVSFDDGSGASTTEYTEPSALVIKGLTLQEAMDVVARAYAAPPLPTGVPAHHESRAADEKARADAAVAKVRDAAQPAKPAPAKPTPEKAKPEPAQPEPGADADDDLGEDVDDASPQLDVAKMSGMDKLRPVIEYMVSAGFSTPEQIVAAAIPLKSRVKALKDLDAKGQFEKRMERAAMTVLAPADAS